jgi:hypothetical protein
MVVHLLSKRRVEFKTSRKIKQASREDAKLDSDEDCAHPEKGATGLLMIYA